MYTLRLQLSRPARYVTYCYMDGIWLLAVVLTTLPGMVGEAIFERC